MDHGRGSPAKVARIIGAHPKTVLRYCHMAVAGEPSKLHDVQRNPVTGRYSINLEEARSLLRQDRDDIEWVR